MVKDLHTDPPMWGKSDEKLLSSKNPIDKWSLHPNNFREGTSILFNPLGVSQSWYVLCCMQWVGAPFTGITSYCLSLSSSLGCLLLHDLMTIHCWLWNNVVNLILYRSSTIRVNFCSLRDDSFVSFDFEYFSMS